MKREQPPSLRSLEARVRNLARDIGVAEGRMRRLIGIVVLGQVLAETAAAAVKGASNIELRAGTMATRVSSDLDTVRKASLEEFRGRLETALRDGWGGFHGVLVDQGEILTPAPENYRPHRFRARLAYVERSFSTVTVEVVRDEAGGLDRIDEVASLEAREWFAILGLPEPSPIPALILSYQMAQKLHACTAPDVEGWVNDRVHDLVDLQIARRIYEGPLTEFRAAAMRLFTSRDHHSWPPVVSARQGWEQRYEAEAEGLDVLATLAAAIDWANAFIAEVDAATG